MNLKMGTGFIRVRPRKTAQAWRRLSVIVLAFIISVPLHADDAAEWKLLDESWYVIDIESQTAGWTHWQLYDDGERFRITTEMVISIERGSSPVSMEVKTESIETHAGRPVFMRSRRVMSQQPAETEWRFDEMGVTGVFRQGGREISREVPHPEGTWLTPRAAHRYRLERSAAGAMEISYRVLEPSSDDLRPTHVRSRRVGEGTFDFEEREIPVTIWSTQTDEIAPLEATEHFSTDGHRVYQELPIGLGTMSIRKAGREQAAAAKGAVAPALFFQSFIEPTGRFEIAAQSRRSTMRLSVKKGEIPELPSTGAQRVALGDDRRTATLTVIVDEPLEASEEEKSNREYVEPAPLVDSEDELIQALARRAVRELALEDRDDLLKQAESLRVFVRRHITRKDLDTAFASASETARLRTGDCTEHAVLLAAMLRAAEIPARLASGLVYVDQAVGGNRIFGWHMWTQALIDGRWIDLDATTLERFHAGYILTNTSSFADGGGSDLSTLLVLIGNLEIEILSAE